jgi:hypothetical protein
VDAGVLHHKDVTSPKKPSSKATVFPDAQGAIEGTLDAWLPPLIEANEILSAALIRVRDFHLAGVPSDNAIMVDVVTALEAAARAQKRL